jgi:hypothetical protein
LGRRQPISPLAEARDGGGVASQPTRLGVAAAASQGQAGSAARGQAGAVGGCPPSSLGARRGEDRSRSRDAPTARRRRESRERDARTGGDVSPNVGIWISWEKETCRVSLAIYILVSRRTKRMDEIRYRVSWALIRLWADLRFFRCLVLPPFQNKCTIKYF